MANGLYQKARQKMLNPIAGLFVTNATNATPIVITTSKNHGLATGDQVCVVGVGGNTAANGTWVITNVDADEFSLDTSVGSGAYTSGGEVLLKDALLKKLPYLVRWGAGSSGELYGDDIKAVLVNVTGAGTLYTPDLAVHEFLSDIPAGARISTSGNLVNKANNTTGPFVGGVADADDITFTAVGPPGTTIEAFVLYKDSGTDTTSPLIAYYDVAVGLPVTASGGNIPVTFDAGANRLFQI